MTIAQSQNAQLNSELEIVNAALADVRITSDCRGNEVHQFQDMLRPQRAHYVKKMLLWLWQSVKGMLSSSVG